MPVSHAMLTQSVETALQPERQFHTAGPNNDSRFRWLSEVELTCRMKSYLASTGTLDPDWLKLNAQGNVAANATNFDIEYGFPVEAAVEVVACWGYDSPKVASELAADLEWMLHDAARHVVAFFPKMRDGYGVQRHPNRYDWAGEVIPRPYDAYVSGQCLSVGGMTTLSQHLIHGIISEITTPPHGNTSRWSLNPDPEPIVRFTPQPGALPVRDANGAVVRTLIGTPDDTVWAVAWSNE